MTEAPSQLLGERIITVDGTEKIAVKVYVPVPLGNDFSCSYSITGPDFSGRLRNTMGVDALQAVYDALQVIGSDLKETAKITNKEYTLGRNADLGFPFLDVD